MLKVDLQNAFGSYRGADNFTVILLRLIAKSDGKNRAKLALGFPLEVEAVRIYQQDCPYRNENHTEVDWDRIADIAVGRMRR